MTDIFMNGDPSPNG